MKSDEKKYLWLDAGSTGYTTTATFDNLSSDVSFTSAMPSVAPELPYPNKPSEGASAGSATRVITVPPTIKMYAVRTDLPNGHLLGIARIMVQWSLQEWLLQQILFDLSTGDPKSGRISVGFPRSEEAVSRIEQLAGLRPIALTSDTATLKREVKRLETYRDQVGHGIWIVDDANRWCVVVYKGNWEAGEWQGISKRVTPHAKPVDEADLAAHLADIVASIALTRSLAFEIRTALDSSREK